MLVDELRQATLGLDTHVACWLVQALSSDWFHIEPGAYEHDDPGGAVCPTVAAAKMAGIWRGGQILPGDPAWGTPEGPVAEVEDFAAYFDLCAEDLGTTQAIEVTCRALDSQRLAGRLAA